MTIIETPAPLSVTEKREALLYNMLSHTAHFLKRFLKHQQRRNTPQSLEAAEYIKQELQTATAWLHEFKGDTTMQDAFATLADELDAQAEAMLQEVVDKADIMDYALRRYAEISMDLGGTVRLLTPQRDWVRWDRIYDGNEYLRTVAEWVRKQGEP